MKTRTRVAISRPPERKRAASPQPGRAHATSPREPRGAAAMLLRLQRSAGNQAVSRLMREYEAQGVALQRAGHGSAPVAGPEAQAPAEGASHEGGSAIVLTRAEAFAEINGVFSEMKESFTKIEGDEQEWNKVEEKINHELRAEKLLIQKSNSPDQIREAVGKANIKIVNGVNSLLNEGAGQGKSEVVQARAEAMATINGVMDELRTSFANTYGDDETWNKVEQQLRKAIHPELEEIRHAKKVEEIPAITQKALGKLSDAKDEFDKLANTGGDSSDAVASGPQKPDGLMDMLTGMLKNLFGSL